MEKEVVIHPAKLRQFGAADSAHFHLVTSPALATRMRIQTDPAYCSCKISVIESMSEFNDALATGMIPERSHVLVIAPDVFFQSPSPELLGPKRKLMAMACNSTPTSVETIRHFIDVMEDTDPEDQRVRTEAFFEVGQAAAVFRFVDPIHDTEATFRHLNDQYLWNEQTGFIDWGEQQIAPAGEISVLPLDIQKFDASLRLDIDGTLAFKGQPVLHNGTPSFLRADQQRLFSQLDTMWDDAVIAHVQCGQIQRLQEASKVSLPARRILEAMFEIDTRYSVIWEIGFAVNTSLRLLRGNHAMNEVFGAQNGSIHWGLGLTPFTQYHLDIITPATRVLNEKGSLIFGGDAASSSPSLMRRQSELGCGCVG